MISNFWPHREPLRKMLLLLFLAVVVSACGASITASSSPTPTSTQASSFSPTPTSTRGIRGIFHEYALPPSQFVPFTITAGPDGNLWFTEIMQNGSVQAGRIERLTPTGTVSAYSLPSANTSATDIITGPDGNLWFTEYDADKIGRITPVGIVTERSTPGPEAVSHPPTRSVNRVRRRSQGRRIAPPNLPHRQ